MPPGRGLFDGGSESFSCAFKLPLTVSIMGSEIGPWAPQVGHVGVRNSKLLRTESFTARGLQDYAEAAGFSPAFLWRLLQVCAVALKSEVVCVQFLAAA